MLSAVLVVAISCSASSSTLALNVASSLRTPMTEVADAFRQETNVNVSLQSGPSSLVGVQILEGAPSDVFAAADQVSMQRVADGGATTTDPKVFAQTQLVLAVSSSSKVKTLADLQRTDVKIVTAIPQVPIRTYTDQALQAGNINVKFASYEIDAKGIVEKLKSGEGDAAFIYEAEANTAGLQIIETPSVMKIRASYYIAATSKNPNAQKLIDFVLSTNGKAILQANGLLTEGF
ncbi:MAG: hypothetical protein RLZZ31_970 [Actinomycetota bacterium]